MASRHSDRDDQKVENLMKQGEFHPSRPRDQPGFTGGHQIGVKSSPSDFIPESHARTVPPGTAHPEFTFTPQNTYNALAGESHPLADPLDFPGGATSRDVHRGMGHPGQGMTSKEIHHDGQQGRKREKQGLAQYGAHDLNRGGADLGRADPRTHERQRALGEDVKGGERGNKGERTAEDLPAESL